MCIKFIIVGFYEKKDFFKFTIINLKFHLETKFWFQIAAKLIGFNLKELQFSS